MASSSWRSARGSCWQAWRGIGAWERRGGWCSGESSSWEWVSRGCARETTRRTHMITDMASYLRFFDSARRRTEHAVAAFPPAAAAWRPPAIEGETGWSIGQIVGHIGGSRLFFASAYCGAGCVWAKYGAA